MGGGKGPGVGRGEGRVGREEGVGRVVVAAI